MTTIEDERPPTPENQHPRPTPSDAVPEAPGDWPRRGRRARMRARAAVRALQLLAWAAVLIGVLVTACARWGSALWHAGWTGAGIAVALAALASPARLVLSRGPRRVGVVSAFFHSALSALLLAVFAGFLAFGLSRWFEEHDRDRHATLRVAATVTDCRTAGDSGSDCTYHWLVDGHAYSSRDGASDQWPDGHPVSVRIDPAHPQRPAVAGGGAWVLWIAVAMGALGTPLALGVWWALEEAADH